MFKKMVTLLTMTVMFVVLMCATSFAITTNEHWYVLTKNNADGSIVNLTAAVKEYTDVMVNTINRASVTVELWRIKGLAYSYWPDIQTLEYGMHRRAWWYGNTSENGNYYIIPRSDSQYMCLSGWFWNNLNPPESDN